MPELNPDPTVTQQLTQLQEQLSRLSQRLDRIERRLGLAQPDPDSRYAAPIPAEAPWLAGPPAANDTPAPSSAPPGPADFDLSRERATEPPPAHAAPSQRKAGTEANSTFTRGPGLSLTTNHAGRIFAAGDRGARRANAGQWEALIGGKWALWLGSVAVFFALAFFLAYTWHYLGNAGRLAVGLLSGAAFVGAGARSRERAEPWFSEGLTGGGLALFYLSLWAGAQRYGLLSFELAFTLMALTTAAGVALAIRYDAVSLSALSTLGGFLTPVLLRSGDTGSGRSLTLLVYLLVLNAGVLAVSVHRRWRGITWLSFAATLCLMLGWATESYTEAQRWSVLTFVSLYFLLFLGASCFHSLIRREETAPADLLLLFAASFVYALAGYGLLWGVMGQYPGTFPLALALFFGLLTSVSRAQAPENRSLSLSTQTLALLFLTLTVPIQLRQGWVTMAYSLEAAVLVTLGLRLQAPVLLTAGQVVWALSLVSLAGVLAQSPPASHLLFLNRRALPLLVSVLASGWMAAQSLGQEPAPESKASGASGRPRDGLAHVYAVFAVLGGAWLIAQETFLGFSAWAGADGEWRARALYTMACLWSLYSVGVAAVGRRFQPPTVGLSACAVLVLAALLPVWTGLELRPEDWTPFWNLRWLSYIVVACGFGAMVRLCAELLERETGTSAQLLVLAIALVVWGLTQETYETFRFFRSSLGAEWDRLAQMSISLVWTLCGVSLLVAGVARQYAPIRLLGLGLFGLTVLKVFLFDLSFLDMPYRILSFGGLGLALIGISWLYSRYGIGRETDAATET